MKSEKYQQGTVMVIQKSLGADPRAIQQTALQGVVGGDDNAKIRLYTILEQSKETVLKFYNETAKVL